MRSFCSEFQEVISIARDHDTLIILRGRENRFVCRVGRQNFRKLNHFVLMPFESVLDRGGDVVV